MIERSLKAFIEHHGLKQKDVAEFLGYTDTHISRCCNGHASLSGTAWRLLESHYGFGG